METANENETVKAPETGEVTEATDKKLDCKLFLHHPEAFDNYVGDKESETCNKVVIFSTEYDPDKYKYSEKYDSISYSIWKITSIAVEVFFLVCIVIVTASLIISSLKCL